MRKTLFAIPILLFLFSCSKSDSDHTRELNITCHEAKGLNQGFGFVGVHAYPNPFDKEVSIFVNDAENYEIIVSTDDGGMKKINAEHNGISLDFSAENSGAYYCVIHYNNKVFRTHLIKK